MANEQNPGFHPTEPSFPQPNPQAGSSEQSAINKALEPQVPQNEGVQQPGGPDISKPVLKKLPIKQIIFGIIGTFLLILLTFLAMKLKPNTPSLFGNKGEIVWWGIQHDAGVYAGLIDEFEKANPGIKVIYTKQSSQDYRERLTNALASGKGPDIYEIHNSWFPMFRNELSALPSTVMDKEEFGRSFYPNIVANLTLDKGIVAMPLEYDALTLFINEDIFTSSLQKPPETWDELKKMVDPKEGRLTLKDKEGRIIQSGVALGEISNLDHWPEILALMMYQNKVNPTNPSGQNMSDVLSFFAEFKKQNVWDDTLPSSTLAFAQGKVAMYFGPTRRAYEIAKNNSKIRFRTFRLPQLPKNTPTDPNFSYNTYWVQSVWDRSNNKEAAWKFLKYLSNKDSLEKINQNIKKYETFQRAYPRPEMNINLREDNILGSIISLALESKSWYLADNTNDGPTGINSQLKSTFGGVLTEWSGRSDEKALTALQDEVHKILAQYSISTR